MRDSLHRYLGLASILLLGAATFAACGGLDPRKVSRGSQFEDGGEPGAAGAPGPSAGGSDGRGGDVGNPFGGQLFDGGAPPVLDGPPEVLRVDPEDEETEVDIDANVSLLFSEAIDSASVNEDSVQLLDGATVIDASVALDASNSVVATINPSRRLALATTYEVSVSTDVTDLGGTALKSAFSSTFTTRDGSWDVVAEPFVADANQWDSYAEAFLTADGRGNALVVWPAWDSEVQNYLLWGRWYRATTGWQDPVQLSSGVGYLSGYRPQASLAADEAGNAVVVWKEQNSTYNYEVYARRYVNGAWSEAPEPLHGNLIMSNMEGDPVVGMRDGRIVVWWADKYYGSGYTYGYAYGQSATVDGLFAMNPVTLKYGYNQTIGYGSVAIDGAGNGLAVFTVYSAGSYSLEFAKYVAATGAWEEAAAIPNSANTTDSRPAVAVADDGAAMVAWRNGASNYDLLASRYTKAKGFGTPVTLDELDTTPELPYDANPLATDGTDFFISWVQLVGVTGNVYGARYSTADGTWSAAELLSDGDTGVNTAPRTVADRHGNAMVLWKQGEVVYDPPNYYPDHSAVEYRYARFLGAEGAWQPSQLLARDMAFAPYASHAASVATNGMVALLSYRDYTYDADGSYPSEPLLNIFR